MQSKPKKLLRVFLSVALTAGVLFAGQAFAQTGGGSTGSGGGGPIILLNPLVCSSATAPSSFQCIAEKVINVLTLIAAPILVIMILVGGLQMMTSAGNEERFKKGRDILKYAVIGFAIILFANVVPDIVRSIFS